MLLERPPEMSVSCREFRKRMPSPPKKSARARTLAKKKRHVHWPKVQIVKIAKLSVSMEFEVKITILVTEKDVFTVSMWTSKASRNLCQNRCETSATKTPRLPKE